MYRAVRSPVVYKLPQIHINLQAGGDGNAVVVLPPLPLQHLDLHSSDSYQISVFVVGIIECSKRDPLVGLAMICGQKVWFLCGGNRATPRSPNLTGPDVILAQTNKEERVF